MAKIRQELSILNTSFASPLTQPGVVQLDPALYSGTNTYYFEIVGGNSHGSTAGVVALRGVGTTTDDAPITIPAPSATHALYRSTAFSPPTTSRTSYFVIITTDPGGTIAIGAARIVVL